MTFIARLLAHSWPQPLPDRAEDPAHESFDSTNDIDVTGHILSSGGPGCQRPQPSVPPGQCHSIDGKKITFLNNVPGG